MIESEKYTEDFFIEMEKSSIRAAEAILPIVNALVQPKSVIDVGCGTGVWLKVWNEHLHVQDYIGIDGPYIKREMVKISLDKIIFKDLKKPLEIPRKFDLAMSLEVAEHLPQSTAFDFVNSLCSLSEIVLFSAALPGQTGTFHINEQYPEYWAALFFQHGFVVIDIIRPKIWSSDKVEFYYKQNILLFVKKEKLSNYPELLNSYQNTDPEYLTRIHPFIFDLKNRQIDETSTFWGYLNFRWYHFKRKYFHKNP